MHLRIGKEELLISTSAALLLMGIVLILTSSGQEESLTDDQHWLKVLTFKPVPVVADCPPAEAIEADSIQLQDEGRLAEAFSGYKKALTLREHLYGPDHYALIPALRGLAGSDFNDKQESLEAAKRMLLIKEKYLGPEAPDVLFGMEFLCDKYLAAREDYAGYTYFHSLLETGKDPLYTATVLSCFSRTARGTLRLAEAKTAVMKAMSILGASIEHPLLREDLKYMRGRIFMSLSETAILLKLPGIPEKALQSAANDFLSLGQAKRRQEGLIAYGALSDILADQHRIDEARAILNKAISIMFTLKEVISNGMIANLYRRRGGIEEFAGRFDAALDYLNRAERYVVPNSVEHLKILELRAHIARNQHNLAAYSQLHHKFSEQLKVAPRWIRECFVDGSPIQAQRPEAVIE